MSWPCLRCGHLLKHGYMAEKGYSTEYCNAELECNICLTGHRMTNGILVGVRAYGRKVWTEIPEGCMAVVEGSLSGREE
jgi:hypothetical protein